ncbi:MAG: DCC1-like thiol-disulfide oxidoreductase family protein [Desulfuromonadaceae bacterium]|nr:DCC1-like thiol-disulfide oxidoreductase family protein [Desulfuromonadaceae bacterium]
MTVTPVFPLRIFYDGSCSVCATEVERYGRKDRDGRLILVDISAPDFDADSFGITLKGFMYQMHAIDQSGRVFRGVETFWAIWLRQADYAAAGQSARQARLPSVRQYPRLSAEAA